MRRWALLAVFLAASCGRSQLPVASRYVKTVPVVAAEGARFTLTAEESPELAGVTVDIPAGALSADTTVTVELGLDDFLQGLDERVGPVVLLGPPDVTAQADLSFTLPYAALPTDAPEDIEVVLKDGEKFGRLTRPAVAPDARAGVVQVWLRRLVGLQPVRRHCKSDTDCAPGECKGTLCRGAQCGPKTCPIGQVCCNASCGICTPRGGGCIATICSGCAGGGVVCPPNTTCVNGVCAPTAVQCGPTTCTGGDVCCNESCGTCVRPGGACLTTECVTKCSNTGSPCPSSDQVCINGVCQPLGVLCGVVRCAVGDVCCNASCGVCARPGGACTTQVCTCDPAQCGPALESPSCICPDQSLGCNTGRCVRQSTGTCGWQYRTCP